MKKLNLLFMALFITLFVVSCSDSGSDPDDTDDGGDFKLTTGSYWIMESYDFKEDGTKDESTVTTDSSYIGIADLIDNVSYLPYITIYTDPEDNEVMMDTMFCRIDKSKLYAIMNISDEDGMDMGMFKTQILLANWGATATWTALSIDTTLQMDMEEMGTVSAATSITLKITPGAMSKYTLNGESIDVKEFTMEMDVDMNIANMMQNVTKSTSHYFISKDKFVMQVIEDETINTLTVMGQKTTETEPGSVSKVIRYHIQ